MIGRHRIQKPSESKRFHQEMILFIGSFQCWGFLWILRGEKIRVWKDHRPQANKDRNMSSRYKKRVSIALIWTAQHNKLKWMCADWNITGWGSGLLRPRVWGPSWPRSLGTWTPRRGGWGRPGTSWVTPCWPSPGPRRSASTTSGPGSSDKV